MWSLKKAYLNSIQEKANYKVFVKTGVMFNVYPEYVQK